jgi:hypothetical protein
VFILFLRFNFTTGNSVHIAVNSVQINDDVSHVSTLVLSWRKVV